MALSMEKRYGMLELGKLPEKLSIEFKGMKENTDNFDPEMVDIEAENFELAWDIVKKQYPNAIKEKKPIKKAAPKKEAKKKGKPTAKPKKKVKQKTKPKAKPKEKVKSDKVTECKRIIKDAGYQIKKTIVKKKKVEKRVKRPDKLILKNNISDAITTIAKDTVKSKEKKQEYSDSLKVLNSIKRKLTEILQSIDKIYNDNNVDKLKKIESLLKDMS